MKRQYVRFPGTDVCDGCKKTGSESMGMDKITAPLRDQLGDLDHKSELDLSIGYLNKGDLKTVQVLTEQLTFIAFRHTESEFILASVH